MRRHVCLAAIGIAVIAGVPQLRAVRRALARRVSDEALLEIELVTKLLRRAVALHDESAR